jgi:hypothetical protein
MYNTDHICYYIGLYSITKCTWAMQNTLAVCGLRTRDT